MLFVTAVTVPFAGAGVSKPGPTVTNFWDHWKHWHFQSPLDRTIIEIPQFFPPCTTPPTITNIGGSSTVLQ